MLGYYRQDMSCNPTLIFQDFCHMPRKNRLDKFYSCRPRNQECRSKNYLYKKKREVEGCLNILVSLQKF